MGYEQLFKRESTFVNRKEVTTKNRWFGLDSMNKTGGRRPMFIARANVAN